MYVRLCVRACVRAFMCVSRECTLGFSRVTGRKVRVKESAMRIALWEHAHNGEKYAWSVAFVKAMDAPE